MITAKFGSKSFEVSSNKIYTPDGISISEELDLEETAVSGAKPTVKVKGIKLQDLDFDVRLDARFVDVKNEISYWKKILLAKTAQAFSLGNYSIGKFLLTKVGIKSIAIGKNGVYLSATISLSFKEYNAPATTTTAKKSSSTSIKIGSTVKPKSGARWYLTAQAALKKTGRSGKAYNKKLKVVNIYPKTGKVKCVALADVGATTKGASAKGNVLSALGWLLAADVTRC